MARFFSIRRRFQLFYMVQFAGIAIFMPYVALYLSDIGLPGRQVGILLGLMPLSIFLLQPFWGLLSDIYGLRRSVLTIGCLGVALSVVVFGLTTAFSQLFIIILVMSAMRAPIVPTSTALALDYLEKENRPNDFGTLRLWGSIGFILTSLIIGGFIVDSSLKYIIVLYSLDLFILTALSLTLPDAPLSRGANWREGLVLLKHEPVLATFLLGVLFVGMTVGIVNQYLAVYLDDIQASGLIIGVAMAISALPEVPLMALVPTMILRWGVTTVFIAGIAVLPARWFLYTIIDNPLLVIPTQLLHGISMTSILVVGVIYVDRLLARRWRTTGQAIYTATQFGIGPSIGLFIAGYLYEYGGVKPIWVFCAVVGLAGLAIVIWSARMPNLNRAAERSQP